MACLADAPDSYTLQLCLLLARLVLRKRQPMRGARAFSTFTVANVKLLVKNAVMITLVGFSPFCYLKHV